jgi:hypothetical protein
MLNRLKVTLPAPVPVDCDPMFTDLEHRGRRNLCARNRSDTICSCWMSSVMAASSFTSRLGFVAPSRCGADATAQTLSLC